MSELLRVLDVEDLPPSTVDLDLAVRRGRARERRRQTLAVIAVCGAVLVVAAGVALAVDRPPVDPAPAEPSPWRCVATPSPLADASLDRSGLAIAAGSLKDMHGAIMLMEGDDPPVEVLGAPGPAPLVSDVNAGVIVGHTVANAATGRNGVGWVYRQGTFSVLAAPTDATRVEPVAVNAHGDIAGTVTYGVAGEASALIRWSAATPEDYLLLPLSDTTQGPEAAAITDDGTIIGTAFARSDAGTLERDVVIWRLGSAMARLPQPGMQHVRGISGDWIYGQSDSEGFRLNLRSGDFQVLTGFLPYADGADGRLAGTTVPGRNPALWHDGVIEVLAEDREGHVSTVGGRTMLGVLDGQFTSWHC